MGFRLVSKSVTLMSGLLAVDLLILSHTPTKHDVCAVRFAVTELLVTFGGSYVCANFGEN